jgi:hypothetical protein
MIPAVRMALAEASRYVGKFKDIRFEQKDKAELGHARDVDVAVFGRNGVVAIYQFKSFSSIPARGLATDLGEGAKQLIGVPATARKLLVAEFKSGTRAQFDVGKGPQSVQTFKVNYPDVTLRLEFADGSTFWTRRR